MLDTYLWLRHLHAARVSVLTLVAAALLLLVPPQMADLLAFLDDGGLLLAFAFHGSIVVLGLALWYWSRAALAAEAGVPDGSSTPGHTRAARLDAMTPAERRLNTWLPRGLFFGAALLGVGLVLRNGVKATDLLILAAWAIAGTVALTWRGKVAWLTNPGRAERAPLGSTADLLDHAPIGWGFGLGLLSLGGAFLALGIAGALGGWGGTLAAWLGTQLPGPCMATFGLALSVGPLTLLAHLGGRFPAMLALTAWLGTMAVAFDDDIHAVWLLSGPPSQRATFDHAVNAWVKACFPAARSGATIRPVIVAASGGATRAAIWASATLREVERATAQPDRQAALFAISSVSGGSLGAAGAMALLAAAHRPDACAPPALGPLMPDQGPIPLSGDSLGPLMAGWLLADLPRTLIAPALWLGRQAGLTTAGGGDSAEAIERGFAARWDTDLPARKSALLAPYLSLFYANGTYRAGMPLWFVNGTAVESGKRVVTGPIDPADASWPLRDTVDLIELAEHDVRIATAVNNGARFPFLEPFGTLRGSGAGRVSLVDGGYFENEGLQTALELAERLAAMTPNGLILRPIIVQATADGEAMPEVAPRNGKPGPEPLTACGIPPAQPGAAPPRTKGLVLQVLAPPMALYNTRASHSSMLLHQARDTLCAPPERFVHFRLGQVNGRDVPLNWVLSQQMAAGVRAYMAALNDRTDAPLKAVGVK